jgi:hypothetical protein
MCGGDNPFSGQRNPPFRAMRARLAQCAPAGREPDRGNRHQRLLAQNQTGKRRRPIRQDRGTIEVGWDTIAPGDDESRSPRC